MEGGRIDTPSRLVEVYWHGEVPAEFWDSVEDSADQGLTVTLANVPYTTQELKDASNRVIEAAGSPDGMSVGSNETLSGVVVYYPGMDETVTIDGVEYDAAERIRAAAEAEMAAYGIPVSYETGTLFVGAVGL